MGEQEFYFVFCLGLFLVLCAAYEFQPLVTRVLGFYYTHVFKILFCGATCAASVITLAWVHYWNYSIKRTAEHAVTGNESTSVFLGRSSPDQKPRYLKEELRTAHTQVIGTTNAGKSASVILPWSIQDMEQGRGMLIIDGKADQSFLNKLYAYAVKFNRDRDFKVFSLANPSISSTYNPFCGGTPEQITERVFSTFNITDPYYASVQFSALRTIIALLMARDEVPTPGVIRELLRNKSLLQEWLPALKDKNLAADVRALAKDSEDEFLKKYSGLVTALGHFSQGATAGLYNVTKPEIDLLEVIRKKQICYFQLPTMQFPFLGAATGKLVLQSLQSAVSEIQVGSWVPPSLFPVYLDDFNDYIYPGFASLLNKSRSANVGVVFSHQSLGDLEKVGPDFKQIVLTNTNIKVIMRSNDPESAEFFSAMIGTKKGEKTTERRSKTLFGHRDTGDQSVREAEEYKFHPNLFKSELGRGQGIVVLPHPAGTDIFRMNFSTMPDLPTVSLPTRELPKPDFLMESSCKGAVQDAPATVPKEKAKADAVMALGVVKEAKKGQIDEKPQ